MQGKLIPLLENAVVHASVLTIIAITTERFYVICFPLRNTLRFKDKSVVKIVAVVWFLAISTSLPLVFMTEQESAVFHDGTPCHVCRTKIEETWHFTYVIGNMCVFFLLPLFLLIAMYAKIVRCLIHDEVSFLCKKNPSSVYNMRTRKQVVRILIGIVILFFLSMLPMRVTTLWLILTPPHKIASVGLEGFLNILSFSRALVYLNSAGNPVIYSLMSTKFRIAFKRLRGRYRPSSQGQRLCHTRSPLKDQEHFSMIKRTSSKETSPSPGKFCLEISLRL